MAEELKKQFQEMHEAKFGKKDEIQVDEFEWIEVGNFTLVLSIKLTIFIL